MNGSGWRAVSCTAINLLRRLHFARHLPSSGRPPEAPHLHGKADSPKLPIPATLGIQQRANACTFKWNPMIGRSCPVPPTLSPFRLHPIDKSLEFTAIFFLKKKSFEMNWIVKKKFHQKLTAGEWRNHFRTGQLNPIKRRVYFETAFGAHFRPSKTFKASNILVIKKLKCDARTGQTLDKFRPQKRRPTRCSLRRINQCCTHRTWRRLYSNSSKIATFPQQFPEEQVGSCN